MVAGPVGVAPLGGSLGSGRLSPHGRLEGSLSYVVPRDGAQLVLRSEGSSDAVPLLRADRAPAGAGKNAHTSGTHP